jgi:2-polyprenyl-3-methyl-5-hydroxy-6-metoxy-1,4-benzoquinol methylase
MSVKVICPYTHEELSVRHDGLVTKQGILKYQKINGAYKVAPEQNYTDSFGLEWNTFQKTQIDKYNGTEISQKRFFAETQWDKEDLNDKNILEVGSGAGRFSQVLLDHTQANLYSVDYSNAVEANFKNNGPHERLHLFQASIYELPFEKASFDKVFCFGVLQHTPDVEKSIKCLVEMVKPGGELIVDFYPIKGWYSKLNAKYLLRPITKKMNHDLLLKIISKNIHWLTKTYQFNKKIGLGAFNRFLPICDLDATFPKEIQHLKEWVILDTFDMFSPAYDNPQKSETVKNWFEELGMKQVKTELVEYEIGLVATVVKGIRV